MKMNENEMKKWNQFRCEIEALSLTPKEKNRIDAEFTLFEERGWERYILLLSEIMKALKEKGVTGVSKGGSAWDSYVLGKLCIEKSDELKKLLSDEKGRRILFNDALRMNWNVSLLFNEFTLRGIIELDAVLDPLVKESGLQMKQTVQEVHSSGRRDNGRRTFVEYVVLSVKSIPEEDMFLILNEKRESSPEEADRLRKYLIIKVTAEWNREAGMAV